MKTGRMNPTPTRNKKIVKPSLDRNKERLNELTGNILPMESI
ncbi:hypothetical protein ES703_57786 [subsurface metagenome]